MKDHFPQAVKEVAHLLDVWLPSKLLHSRIPGVSVGITYKGKLLYAQGFGFADLERKIPATEKTQYHIASISKTFTTVAIMQLVEQGKVRLDDKLNQYIPWFQGKNKIADANNITIRQVLSHTSGIFRDGDTDHWISGNFPKDLSKSFSSTALILENATSFKYTNYGFSLLGLVIEKVSGLTYGEYCKKHILRLLKMDSTFTDFHSGIANVAVGYGRDIPGEERVIFESSVTHAYAPATGCISDVMDVGKLISALAFDSKVKLLSRESKKEIMRSYEKTIEDEEYGLGLAIEYISGRKIVGHSGGFRGFITQALVDPESGLGVVILSNCLGSPVGYVASGIFEAVYALVDNVEEQRGKRLAYGKYEGVYRNIWADTVVAPFGSQLLLFAPEANYPMRSSAKLIPQKNKSHSFVIKTKNLYGAPGETAVFCDFRKGRATTLMVGVSKSTRV